MFNNQERMCTDIFSKPNQTYAKIDIIEIKFS